MTIQRTIFMLPPQKNLYLTFICGAKVLKKNYTNTQHQIAIKRHIKHKKHYCFIPKQHILQITLKEIKKMVNIIKVRDDYEPVKFELIESKSELNKFKICEGSSASWTDQEFTVKDLRNRIEPWLTSLFQSEHLSLLVGPG